MNVLKIFADIGNWMTKDTANVAITIAAFLFLLYLLIYGP